MKRAMILLILAVGGTHAHAQTLPAAPDGKALFARNCAACHQLGGAGIPGAFPALKANHFVLGEPAPVIATVLKGRAGMPAFAASLDDAQLAAVLSYVRGAWTNSAAAVSVDAVAAVRGVANAGVGAPERATIIH
jgi:cytochrome c6